MLRAMSVATPENTSLWGSRGHLCARTARSLQIHRDHRRWCETRPPVISWWTLPALIDHEPMW